MPAEEIFMAQYVFYGQITFWIYPVLQKKPVNIWTDNYSYSFEENNRLFCMQYYKIKFHHCSKTVLQWSPDNMTTNGTSW